MPTFFFNVLELAEGGELFGNIIEKTKLNKTKVFSVDLLNLDFNF